MKSVAPLQKKILAALNEAAKVERSCRPNDAYVRGLALVRDTLTTAALWVREMPTASK